MAHPVMKFNQEPREELFERIMQSLDQMPDLLREVFILSHYRGSPPSEIASTIGASEEETAELLRQANQCFFQGLYPDYS
ncbi:hypothetical protein MYX84_14060 [Acidobacteria bacterium AH-259-O06]|nr:hypothetical protein [Acidobacteria bacterium AH-259-O06]